jgi:hypothetical protein
MNELSRAWNEPRPPGTNLMPNHQETGIIPTKLNNMKIVIFIEIIRLFYLPW